MVNVCVNVDHVFNERGCPMKKLCCDSLIGCRSQRSQTTAIIASRAYTCAMCHQQEHHKTVMHCAFLCALQVDQAYLPGTGDTVITEAVPPERGLSIALRFG